MQSKLCDITDDDKQFHLDDNRKRASLEVKRNETQILFFYILFLLLCIVSKISTTFAGKLKIFTDLYENSDAYEIKLKCFAWTEFFSYEYRRCFNI